MKRLFSIVEAAEYLGRTKGAVYEMIYAKKIPHVRGDRRIQIDVRDLDEWIEKNKETTGDGYDG